MSTENPTTGPSAPEMTSELRAADPDWSIVAEAVRDAVSNGEGEITEGYLKLAFERQGLVVTESAATAAAPGSEGGVEDELRAAATNLIADLDRSLRFGKDDRVITATNSSVKRLRAALAHRSALATGCKQAGNEPCVFPRCDCPGGQYAPATGGAARLDREAVARIIDPEVWALWDKYVALRLKRGEILDGAKAAADRRVGSHKTLSLRKADAILAFDPAPQSHAASEGVREATYPHSGNLQNWRCPECRCHTYAQVVEGKSDGSFGPGPLIRCVNCKSVFDTRPAAAITPAGRGADAGEWRPIETAAARDVLAERQRQVTAEGWTPEHDDTHAKGELAIAAACYATAPPAIYAEREWMFPDRPKSWPWHPSWWKPNFYRRNLVKAGALILAEIERLDRAAAPAAPTVPGETR